ncbi:MAG: CDGSH iron-sulfur domain-containing protein, partial [Candidatus Dadabacteria bacterium]|nr:CDGSH iron-sulfur domain-containing protein [Candidatus Dadabacteria bacterium]NIV15543.1 CDGSH iron-sulfur domain-containing protein [Fodinibius sp.]NIV71651.1 CDGSH iron-sulfur domain-containing protein [Calditrichia bacterium]NIV98274.1 CDGSH iron-sulfur domain-containing protein [Candidatus Saccharibacteria bacterium]NIW78546.1 CDGSH iron-sulfur domain-containing protein [Calditrichia bacterium]
ISGQPAESSKNIALCRCGSSVSKPFCDGTHKDIGFKS